MIVTVVILVLILIWVAINAWKMIQNVRHGRSIDGCDGDCSHCKGCHTNKK